ncbi:MAG: four helix bundle protein [Saprospiraceae bacterium]
MKIKNFEEIIAWQKAQELAVLIYDEFRNSKDFGFRDQICRAVVSISNNIAEGFDRSSDADFCRFLYMSLGSCSEVKSMLYLATKLNYINLQKQNNLLEKSQKISKVINGFIKSLQKNDD